MPSINDERLDRLMSIQREAQQILAGLDELGLNQAAAYVAMALDAMRRYPREELPTG